MLESTLIEDEGFETESGRVLAVVHPSPRRLKGILRDQHDLYRFISHPVCTCTGLIAGPHKVEVYNQTRSSASLRLTISGCNPCVVGSRRH